MKNMNKPVAIIQTVLILIISAVVSYSLWGNALAFVPFAGISGLGIWLVVFKNWGPEWFTVLTGFVAMPAILKHNTVDILYQIMKDWTIGQEISSTEAVGLGLIVMVGYLALKYLNMSQKQYVAMLANKADKHEANQVLFENQSIIVLILIAGTVLTMAIILSTNVFNSPVTNLLTHFTGNALVLGLAAVVIIGVYLFWLGRIGKEEK